MPGDGSTGDDGAGAMSEVPEFERELVRLRGLVRELETENTRLERENDEFRRAQAELAGVAGELDAVRHSTSYRIGNAFLQPFVTLRRVARAWRRSAGTS